MSGILVTYFSRTGNTKKIAEAIFGALRGENTIIEVSEETDLDSPSLIFIGFPVYSHSIPIAVEKFLKRVPRNKKIALFSTHGSLAGSRLSRQALEYASVIASQANIIGTFSCRGEISHAALEVLEKSPEHRAWVDMAASAHSHPDEDDLKEARDFAHWVMTLSSQA